jgi:hypothetical protein
MVAKLNELEYVNNEFSLMINVNKTKEVGINTLIMKNQIVQWQEFEDFDNFQYLGSLEQRQEVQRLM